MITTCTICQARYRLDGTKVPKKIIRVRCPACSGVFVLDGTAPPLVTDFQEDVVKPAVEQEVAFETPESLAPEAAHVEETFQSVEAPPVSDTVPAAPAAAVIEPQSVKPRRRRSKEEMLARALVSDILVYNRDLRDTAIKDGKLLEVLGGEIKKSWELYKEKVTPDVANSTNHFREALNEILAEGEKVF